MHRQELIDLVKLTTHSFEDYPFNTAHRQDKIIWTVMRQVTNQKIIALIFEKNDALMIDLKLTPDHGEIMRQRQGVYPGYHMNKTHWNTIIVNDTDLSKTKLINMIKESDRLTS